MAVKSIDRRQSKIEFVNIMNKIRDNLYSLLYRDFGIKHKVVEVKKLMTDLNKSETVPETEIKEIEDKIAELNIDKISYNKIPEWMIIEWRKACLCSYMSAYSSIIQANSIYIYNNKIDYFIRRVYWNKAIGFLHVLKNTLYDILTQTGINSGQFNLIFDLIRKEVDILRKVRKSDNKILANLNYSTNNITTEQIISLTESIVSNSNQNSPYNIINDAYALTVQDNPYSPTLNGRIYYIDKDSRKPLICGVYGFNNKFLHGYKILDQIPNNNDYEQMYEPVNPKKFKKEDPYVNDVGLSKFVNTRCNDYYIDSSGNGYKLMYTVREDAPSYDALPSPGSWKNLITSN